MVNEPSVFEPLKFYYILLVSKVAIMFWNVLHPETLTDGISASSLDCRHRARSEYFGS